MDHEKYFNINRYCLIMRHIIELSDYNISIGPIKSTLREYLSERIYSKIAILVDECTSIHCLPLIKNLITQPLIITIQSGEKNKVLETTKQIWSKLADAGFDRHSLMINLGGGVIGDMGGFAASCYMRGIDFIQVPTTLLSQVDASIGGKLAIDFKGLKNFIGLFQNPCAVLIDPVFLSTLSVREKRSGYAEMIKHGLIRDKVIWSRLRSYESWEHTDWNYEIYQSVLIKKAIVEIDPKEIGIRKILNFGHTIGHAVESLALNSKSPLLHGEAIAIGMVAESVLSCLSTGLSSSALQNIVSFIRKIYTDLPLESLDNIEEIKSIMNSDKKNKDGKIMFSLLEGEGRCTYDKVTTKDQIEQCVKRTYEMLSDI